MRLRSTMMPSSAFNQKQNAEACNGRVCTILDPILYSDEATHLEIYEVSGLINPYWYSTDLCYLHMNLNPWHRVWYLAYNLPQKIVVG